MIETDETRSPVATVAGCALLVVVVPLFAIQALGLLGVIASANGFGRFVPDLWDVDGDGTRELTIGCPNDPCTTCTWHDFGPVQVGSIEGTSLCEPW